MSIVGRQLSLMLIVSIFGKCENRSIHTASDCIEKFQYFVLSITTVAALLHIAVIFIVILILANKFKLICYILGCNAFKCDSWHITTRCLWWLFGGHDALPYIC